MSSPRTIPLFYTYLYRAYPWIKNSATIARLGIPPASITALDALVGDEVTAGTFFYNQKQYDMAPKRKDTLLCQNLKASTKDVRKKIADILNDTAASKWNNDDRDIFMLKKGLARSISKPKDQIPFECVVDVVPDKNGVIDFSAKPRDETKRAHMPPGCNAIEMASCVVQSSIRKVGDNPDKVRETCIGVDDHTTIKVFFKAKFQHTVETALIGYDLYTWFRFTNTHYPQFAGKWSTVHVDRIV